MIATSIHSWPGSGLSGYLAHISPPMRACLKWNTGLSFDQYEEIPILAEAQIRMGPMQSARLHASFDDADYSLAPMRLYSRIPSTISVTNTYARSR